GDAGGAGGGDAGGAGGGDVGGAGGEDAGGAGCVAGVEGCRATGGGGTGTSGMSGPCATAFAGMRRSDAGFSSVGCDRGRGATTSLDGVTPRPTQPARATHIVTATANRRVFLPPAIAYPLFFGTNTRFLRARSSTLQKKTQILNPKSQISNLKSQ